MQRKQLIEQISRLVHNGQPTDDTEITDNLINLYLNQGIALAAKQNYKEAIQLDGVGYVNNSFFTTFKGIAVEPEEKFLWSMQLPQVPVSIGKNEGISNLRFKDEKGNVSIDAIPLSIKQQGYANQLRPVPDKILYYIEGGAVKIITPLLMNNYTSSVTMISGGDSNNLDSEINLPDDSIPMVIDYVSKLLIAGRNMPQDAANDGIDKA